MNDTMADKEILQAVSSNTHSRYASQPADRLGNALGVASGACDHPRFRIRWGGDCLVRERE
jgi:hypothetical protein